MTSVATAAFNLTVHVQPNAGGNETHVIRCYMGVATGTGYCRGMAPRGRIAVALIAIRRGCRTKEGGIPDRCCVRAVAPGRIRLRVLELAAVVTIGVAAALRSRGIGCRSAVRCGKGAVGKFNRRRQTVRVVPCTGYVMTLVALNADIDAVSRFQVGAVRADLGIGIRRIPGSADTRAACARSRVFQCISR